MSGLTNIKLLHRNEMVAAGGLCIVAALLRFHELGSTPLSSDEAKSAMSAWRVVADGWQVEARSMMPTSPLLHTLQVFSFWVGGSASAAMVRFWPAFAGTLLVLWPMLLRSWIGRGPALLGVCLQAISPVLWIISRTGDGMSLALLCGLTMLAAWRVFCISSDRRALTLAGSSLGAGLAAGPAFVTIVLFIVVSLMFNSEFCRANWRRLRPEIHALLLPVAITFVLCATAFFRYPIGLLAAGNSWGMWLSNWSPVVARRHSLLIPGLLMIHEGMLVILALSGLYWRARRRERIRGLVALSLIGLCFGIFYPGRQSTDAIWIILPLTIFASEGVMSGLTGGLRRWEVLVSAWQVGALLMVASFGYMAIADFAYGERRNLLPGDWDIFLQIGVLAILSFLVVFLFASAWSRLIAWRGIILTLVLSLIGCSSHSRWRLAAEPGGVGLDFWHPNRVAVDGELLLQTLEDVSLHSVGNSREVQIAVIGEPQWRLEWLLRDYPNLKWRSGLPLDITMPVLIVAQDVSTHVIDDRYYGQEFGDTVYRITRPVDNIAWANYLLFGKVPVEQTKLSLWVRTDLLLQDGDVGRVDSEKIAD